MLASIYFTSGLPGSTPRIWLLRMFGAQIGAGVVVKPRVRVTFPWRLSVGKDSWIGEGVWIDNLTDVNIGRDCCLSQGAYLCTGSHDWSVETFDLLLGPIVVEDGAWIGAFAKISPNVVIERDVVVALGSVLTSSASAGKVYSGNPAIPVRDRFKDTSAERKS